MGAQGMPAPVPPGGGVGVQDSGSHPPARPHPPQTTLPAWLASGAGRAPAAWPCWIPTASLGVLQGASLDLTLLPPAARGGPGSLLIGGPFVRILLNALNDAAAQRDGAHLLGLTAEVRAARSQLLSAQRHAPSRVLQHASPDWPRPAPLQDGGSEGSRLLIISVLDSGGAPISLPTAALLEAAHAAAMPAWETVTTSSGACVAAAPLPAFSERDWGLHLPGEAAAAECRQAACTLTRPPPSLLQRSCCPKWRRACSA